MSHSPTPSSASHAANCTRRVLAGFNAVSYEATPSGQTQFSCEAGAHAAGEPQGQRLMYERRIEHSLYRTTGEFQKQRLMREAAIGASAAGAHNNGACRSVSWCCRGFRRPGRWILFALRVLLSYTLMGVWLTTTAAQVGVYHQQPWLGQGWGRWPGVVATRTEAQSRAYEQPIRYDVGFWNEEE